MHISSKHSNKSASNSLVLVGGAVAVGVAEGLGGHDGGDVDYGSPATAHGGRSVGLGRLLQEWEELLGHHHWGWG